MNIKNKQIRDKYLRSDYSNWKEIPDPMNDIRIIERLHNLQTNSYVFNEKFL